MLSLIRNRKTLNSKELEKLRKKKVKENIHICLRLKTLRSWLILTRSQYPHGNTQTEKSTIQDVRNFASTYSGIRSGDNVQRRASFDKIPTTATLSWIS